MPRIYSQDPWDTSIWVFCKFRLDFTTRGNIMIHLNSVTPKVFCNVAGARRTSYPKMPSFLVIFPHVVKSGLNLQNTQIDVSHGSGESIRCIWAHRMQICLYIHKITFFRPAEGFNVGGFSLAKLLCFTVSRHSKTFRRARKTFRRWPISTGRVIR